MPKSFILFARRESQSPWMRIRTTARTTNPVTKAVALAKAAEWVDAGWIVQLMNVTTQESREITHSGCEEGIV